MRAMLWVTICALVIFTPVLLALSGPVRSFSNPNVACGSAVQDGGCNTWDDAGGAGVDGGCAGSADGGYQVDLISAESMASIKIENNTTTPVYLGGSTVQPGSNVLAICTDTATCHQAGISIDTETGALYCTATASTTVRALAGGY